MKNEIDILCEKFGGRHDGRNRDTRVSNIGGDMSVLGYTRPYEQYFSSRKSDQISLLEIGIFRGAGLAVWSRYFENGKIYGADLGINEFNANMSNWKAVDNKTFENLAELYAVDSRNTRIVETLSLPKFDIIIDDGKHTPEAQYATFCNFWPYLNAGGVYVIEDIATRNRLPVLQNSLKSHENEFSSIEHFEADDNINSILFIQK